MGCHEQRHGAPETESAGTSRALTSRRTAVGCARWCRSPTQPSRTQAQSPRDDPASTQTPRQGLRRQGCEP
uniref:Uncharacterized protein n=1 Tax=uncultured marine virus TaxID=186617 RepID=A0A0F7L644_9VIRU|nr:hypothetical protein [uncultured marine virus]